MAETPTPETVGKGAELSQISPDGRHRWDGHTWQLVNPEPPPRALQPSPPTVMPAQFPIVQRVEMRAGAAFRMGFFAFFGAGCASIVFWVIALLAVVALAAAGVGLGSLPRPTP